MKRPPKNVVAPAKKLKYDELSCELGIILSVTLQNFMCHDHLKFDFDPHINFIIGQNGSGKSAVLTGIVLALGGKSSVTHRFHNVKGFVKTGKNKALVSVTLKNCGISAFKPELYGDKIIVEREISIEGVSSSYKLKNAQGKVVSTLKEDLTSILIAMDIQIDNPVLVLTQETSRSFLMAKTGKEEKLYEFFYRGTGLLKLTEDYELSVSTNEECAKELKAKNKVIEGMEKEIKQLEKLRESDEKLDELKRESFWAKIKDMENQLQILQIAKDKLVKQIEITRQQVESCKNKYNSETLLLESTKKEKAELHERVEKERKTLEELSSQSDICTDNKRRCKGQVDLYQREERKLLEDIQVIQDAIHEHEMKGQTDYENERRQRNEKIHILQRNIEDEENQQAELGRRQENLLHEQNSKQQEINVLQSEIANIHYKRNIRNKEYSNLINSKKNRQFSFGEHTPNVLQDIERNRCNFKQLPRGPIGLNIEVRDPKWNGAIEACIKPNMLRSFCVDNSEDSVLMRNILQKYYRDRMPSVIVSPFLPRVHDVSRHKAQTNIPTVLDMLIIKDPVIANCLIDQLSIENIILFEDITTANNIMLDRPPTQCYSAFLQNCDEIQLNPYRFYSATRNSSNILSRTVDENCLEELKHEINILDQELQDKENKKIDEISQHKNYPIQLKQLENIILRLSASISNKRNQIEDLKQYEEPRNVPEMHDELSSLNTDLERKQEELNEAKEKLAIHTMKSNEVLKKVNAQMELVNSLKHKNDSLGSIITKCIKNKELLDSSKKKFEEDLKISERTLQNLECEVHLADEGIKKSITDRKRVDNKPRISTNRSYEEIDMQIKETEKVIAEQSKSSNKISLHETYIERRKQLLDAKQEYKNIEGENAEIKRMMKKREENLKEILRYSKLVVGCSFEVLLRGNAYTGSLNFKEKALELQAAPDRSGSGANSDNRKGNSKRNCSALSGGERSFVTIAFLLALWDRIQMPFRILDEYDVFMDSSNRHLSINLLIRKAKQMTDVQFIFLSPLDLPDMKISDASIKVHKMPPPQRIGLSNMEE